MENEKNMFKLVYLSLYIEKLVFWGIFPLAYVLNVCYEKFFIVQLINKDLKKLKIFN